MIQKHLPEDQFNSVIRWIKTTDTTRLEQLVVACSTTLKRLGLAPALKRVVRGATPAGSDHFDNGSLLDWMDKVELTDKVAVKQILKIHATAVDRLS